MRGVRISIAGDDRGYRLRSYIILGFSVSEEAWDPSGEFRWLSGLCEGMSGIEHSILAC